MNVSMLACAVLGVLCALFGVYKFTGDYTCWIVKWNKTLKNGCTKIAWIPSGCIIGFVLGIAIMRANSMS